MTPPLEPEQTGLRARLRERLRRFRSRSRSGARTTSAQQLTTMVHDQNHPLSESETVHSTNPDFFRIGGDSIQSLASPQTARLHESHLIASPSVSKEESIACLDLWSDAFREAVISLGKEIDVTLLKGKNVEQLFKELEEMGKEVASESAFLRGVKRLKSIQVPLEKFKLALDLASPLTSLEPTVDTVFSIVTGVTAIAISLASIDLEFAKQIGEMLEQLSYIDDCDTLGQKAHKHDIHKALVSVYVKLLEFYKAVLETVTKKGAQLVVKVILEKDRLPSLVQNVLRQAEVLQKLVQKATWEVAEDIKIMLYDREISRWLGGEKTLRQSAHHANLRDIGDDQACELILNHPNFASWYCKPYSYQLAIFGDMGCGKTITSACIVDELGRRNRHQLPRSMLCYHYCQDNETGEASYVLSSLILSLLEQLPGLKKAFVDLYKDKQASGNFEPATSRRQLEFFLQRILDSLDRPIYMVIDGLDECSRDSRLQLLGLLRMLSQKRFVLKTLITSRPDQEISQQLPEGLQINLVSNTHRDRIIVIKTIARRLPLLSEDIKELIIEKLSGIAHGSAIWTRAVIELIAVREIRTFNSVQSFLGRLPLPGELSSLYTALMSRCTSDDAENLDLSSNALKLLAAAHRPLSILELSWAVALKLAPPNVTTVQSLAELVDHQRVLQLIRPFIASVDFSDLRERQVRLVHQSVKEFIYAKTIRDHQLEKTSASQMAPNSARTGELDEFILDICIRYLLLDEIGHVKFFSNDQLAINELPVESNLFNEAEGPNNYTEQCTWDEWETSMIHYDPNERGFGEFFVYASCYWNEHLNLIATRSSTRLMDIEEICQVGSIRLNNWTQQYCRPNCVVQPRFEFESSLYDPLSIASVYGSATILEQMLMDSDIDGANFHNDTITKAAHQILQWGNLSKLRILLTQTRSVQRFRWFEVFCLVIDEWCYHYSRHYDWSLAFDLVEDMSDELYRERSGNELLCIAAKKVCLPLMTRLISKAQHDEQLWCELWRVDPYDTKPASLAMQSHQSIGQAILGNHTAVVEYLLRQESIEGHLRYLNIHNENVLHLASIFCNPAMFRALASVSQDLINELDNEEMTPLMRVIVSPSRPCDRYESAKHLLSHRSVSESTLVLSHQEAALRTAVKVGDVDMCGLLLLVGFVDPTLALSNGTDTQWMLKDETVENESNRPSILQLLCQNIQGNVKAIEPVSKDL